mmetsp:Transcript_27259/g.73997  ORF Transcript_27259/g.73997 Transcript_27259/m.73997 type:complete len:211 (+) Transcript_27259:542-1174(+)
MEPFLEEGSRPKMHMASAWRPLAASCLASLSTSPKPCAAFRAAPDDARLPSAPFFFFFFFLTSFIILFCFASSILSLRRFSFSDFVFFLMLPPMLLFLSFFGNPCGEGAPALPGEEALASGAFWAGVPAFWAGVPAFWAGVPAWSSPALFGVAAEADAVEPGAAELRCCLAALPGVSTDSSGGPGARCCQKLTRCLRAELRWLWLPVFFF